MSHLRITIVSRRHCVVIREPSWLLELAGWQPTERNVVGVQAPSGSLTWLYEDGHSDRHVRVEPRIAREIDAAYAGSRSVYRAPIRL